MSTRWRRPARGIAVAYVLVLIGLPVALIVARALAPGVATLWASITTPAALSALRLSLLLVAVVVPVNVVFGVATAMLLARSRFRGKRLLESLVDLPFAVSPVIVGLAVVLLWGTGGVLARLAKELGVNVLGFPGMVAASIFVTAPFVVREVEPVLREIGPEPEQASAMLGARPWQTFRMVTLPGIRWGLTYGVVLTIARTLGEYGAVMQVSANNPGVSPTLTLLVSARDQRGDEYGSYAISTLMMAIAVLVLLVQAGITSHGRGAAVKRDTAVESIGEKGSFDDTGDHPARHLQTL